MTTKSMAYDHPVYRVRLQYQPSGQAAGASKTYDKFVAFTNMHVFSIGAACVTAGTSTYTAWNGTATVTTTGTGDTLTGYKVSGSTTTTYGPYALNAAAGAYNNVALYQTGAGSATGVGGVALSAGDVFYMARGTDATAVQVPYMEYGIDPLASITV